MRRPLALAAVAAATVLAPPAASLPAQAAPRPALTLGTIDSIYSPTLKEQRRILVYTPPSYSDTTYTPQRYPVLYLLDGDAHFHSVTGLFSALSAGVNGTFVIPEMIVVAIPNTDRMRDLSPTRVTTDFEGKPSPSLATSGGMPQFLRFIRDELVPRIDAQYRTAPYRVLVGHSLGGITAINALYTMPEAFNAYVAIDPSLWWDNRVLLKQARGVVETRRLEGRTLVMAQANTLQPDDTTDNAHYNAMLQFNSIMGRYNQSGLRYQYRLYPEDDHGSVPLIAEYDALRFIFAGYKADLIRAMASPAYVTEHFAAVSAQLGYTITPPEMVGDMLAMINRERDLPLALRHLRDNAARYPRSAHAAVALADALQQSGDATGALAWYRKVLDLRPGDARAREMAAKLGGGGAR